MDIENEGEKIFQYYTIVDNSTLVNAESTDDASSSHDSKILFLTFDEDAQTNPDNFEVEAEASNTDAEESEESSFLANLKLVTLADGRMFVTADDYQSVMNVANGEELEPVQVAISDDTLTNKEFQEIELEDGSTAIVDVSLWNNLLQNVNRSEGVKTEKKFACTFDGCGKFYTTAHHLAVHIRSHTGTRPYQCEVKGCKKAFSTGYSLKAHHRTHTGEKPYGCNECSKHFKTSGDLQKHIRTHTGEKPFKCPIEGCGRSFTTSNIRKVHVRSHTGERPFTCTHPDCGKAFASATNFRNHMRIHSGEKPYVCSVEGCGKRFTEYSSLYKHNGVHQSYKPFHCKVCGQQCKHESTLNTHMRGVHNVFTEEDVFENFISASEIKMNLSERKPEVQFLDVEMGGGLMSKFS